MNGWQIGLACLAWLAVSPIVAIAVGKALRHLDSANGCRCGRCQPLNAPRRNQ